MPGLIFITKHHLNFSHIQRVFPIFHFALKISANQTCFIGTWFFRSDTIDTINIGIFKRTNINRTENTTSVQYKVRNISIVYILWFSNYALYFLSKLICFYLYFLSNILILRYVKPKHFPCFFLFQELPFKTLSFLASVELIKRRSGLNCFVLFTVL